tara:strand:+ start:2799 stop:3761 length:963 start_codon:yes stop_codon:yes gene_type:complete
MNTSAPGYFCRFPSLSYADTVGLIYNLILFEGIRPIVISESLLEKINQLSTAGDLERDLSDSILVHKKDITEKYEEESHQMLLQFGLKDIPEGSIPEYSYEHLRSFFRDWFISRHYNASFHDFDTDYVFNTLFSLLGATQRFFGENEANSLINFVSSCIANHHLPVSIPIVDTFTTESIEKISSISEWHRLLILRQLAAQRRDRNYDLLILKRKLQQSIDDVRNYVCKHWANTGTLVSSAYIINPSTPGSYIPVLFSLAKHFQDIANDFQEKPPSLLCFHRDPRYSDWTWDLIDCRYDDVLFQYIGTLDSRSSPHLYDWK